MELPQVGKQCVRRDCKQLDFLPITCKNCNQTFCTEHFNEHSLSCCVKNNQVAENELKKIDGVFMCSHENCKETSIVPLVCEKCGKHFCIKHRHVTECGPVDPAVAEAFKRKIALPIAQFNKAKENADREVENNINLARKKDKKRDLANKVQLMKIKNKATGRKSVPTTDRVYFNVYYYYPKKDAEHAEEKSQAVFVSKTWSVGRSIDAIAEECKIVNNNHRTTEKKLRLFRKDDGNVLSEDMSELLSVLLQNQQVFDGESLVIEYVEAN